MGTENGETGTPPIDIHALTAPDLRELMISLGFPMSDTLTPQEAEAALAVAQVLPDQAWGLLLNPGMAVSLKGSLGPVEDGLQAALSTVRVAPGGERSQVLELSASMAVEAGLRSEALRRSITPEFIDRLPEGARETVRGWSQADDMPLAVSVKASMGERFTYQAVVPPDVGARIAAGDMDSAPNPVNPMDMPVGSSVLMRGEAFTANSLSARYRRLQFDDTLANLEGQGIGIRRLDDTLFEVTTGPMEAMKRDAFLGVTFGNLNAGINRATRIEGQHIAVAQLDLSTPEGQRAYESFMQSAAIPSAESPGVPRVGERGQLTINDSAGLAMNRGPVGLSVGINAHFQTRETRWADGVTDVQTVWRHPASGTYSQTHSEGADGTVDASSRRWTATFQGVDGAAAQRLYDNFSDAGGPRVGFPETLTVNMSFTEAELMRLRDRAIELDARQVHAGEGPWEPLAQAQNPNEVFRAVFLPSNHQNASDIDALFGAMHAQSDAGALPGNLGFRGETAVPVQIATRGQPGNGEASPGVDATGSGWIEAHKSPDGTPQIGTAAPVLTTPPIEATGDPTLPGGTEPAPTERTSPARPTPGAPADTPPLTGQPPAQRPMADIEPPSLATPLPPADNLDELAIPDGFDATPINRTPPVLPTAEVRVDTARLPEPIPGQAPMAETAAPSLADPMPTNDNLANLVVPGEAAPPLAMANPPARPAAPQTDAAPLAPEAPSQQPASATISPGYDMQDGLLRPNEEGIGVLGLQTALQRQGHALQADMRFGPDTEQALRSFQTSNGLRVDGIAGPETFAALNQRSAPHMADGLMRQNDRGVGVLGTQTALRQLGHELNADSVFGPVTERAVRDFQQASGLAVDGTVGPNTSAALMAATRTMLSPDRAAALSPQAPGSSAVATSNATGNPLSLTPDQQRHLQLAREQLGPALTACGSSPELVERICAAAVSHTQQHADRGPVNAFFLSKDGERVAVVQQIAPMSEMNVAAAGQRSSEQHLAQAQQLAIDQQQTTQTRSHTAPAMAEHTR